MTSGLYIPFALAEAANAEFPKSVRGCTLPFSSFFHAGVAKLVDLPAGRQARAKQLMFTVYVLRSSHREYWYVGLTHDVNARVARHQAGRERTTRAYKPFELVYLRKFDTRAEARQHEKYLKSGAGKEWLKSTALKVIDLPQ